MRAPSVLCQSCWTRRHDRVRHNSSVTISLRRPRRPSPSRGDIVFTVPPRGSMRHPPSGGSRRRRTGPGWAVNRCFSAVLLWGSGQCHADTPRAEAHRAERCPQPVRPVPGRLLQAVAGDLGGELGAGGDVELGEHVHQVGLHGPPRDVLPLADLRVGQPCRRPSWRRPARPGSGWPSRNPAERAARAHSARPASVTASPARRPCHQQTAFSARAPRGTRAGRARDARPARRHAGGRAANTVPAGARPWPSVKQPTVRTDRPGGPDTVRYTSVDTATRRPEVTRPDTWRDKNKTARRARFRSQRAVYAGGGRCWVRTNVG